MYKKNIIILIVLLVIVLLFIIGRAIYCNIVVDKIADEFLKCFQTDSIKDIKEDDMFYELKTKLKEREYRIITLNEEVNNEIIDSTINTLEEIEGIEENYIEEDLKFLYEDTREKITDVGEIIKIGNYYYSNSNTVYLRDIPFENKELKDIIYDNYMNTVYKSDYPLTFTEILKSPKYHFYYKCTDKDNRGYYIKFENELGNSNVYVYVEFNWLLQPIISIENLGI